MLELTELDVFYGDAQALKSLSFKVEEGRLVALVGSNGAGKSTVLKTIAGLIRPDGGHIEFLGEDLTLLRPEEIVDRGISMVPEGRWLFTKMTLADNLILGAYTPRARKSVSNSLTQVLQLFPFLKPRLRRSAGSLSGGEQQMLAIGRALMSQPRLLMLDEPSLGLAPLIVKTMFDVIERLHKDGVTVLLVEQNVYETLKLAQMAFVIRTGAISLSGEGKALLEDPGVQKAFLGVAELLT